MVGSLNSAAFNLVEENSVYEKAGNFHLSCFYTAKYTRIQFSIFTSIIPLLFGRIINFRFYQLFLISRKLIASS